MTSEVAGHSGVVRAIDEPSNYCFTWAFYICLHPMRRHVGIKLFAKII
jgi:hypothetical protein